MFGLEYVMAGYFHLAAATKEYKCPVPGAPKFNVVATGMDYVVDHTKSITELTASSAGVYSPYAKGTTTFTDGLMKGNIQVGLGFEWGTSYIPNIETSTCLSVRAITVKMHIDPTIHIAREYTKGSCHYNAVMGHEMKHIYVDRQVVNKYTTIIVKGLGNAFKKMGYVYGPVGGDQKAALEKQIYKIIESIVTQYADNMNAERELMQRKVDTIAEYDRVSALCEPRPGAAAGKNSKKKN